MATVRLLDRSDVIGARSDSEVAAKVRLIVVNGKKFIQIGTYRSPDRQEADKQSQSIRLSQAASNQPVQLGNDHF